MQNLITAQKEHLFEGGHIGITITGKTLDGDPIALTEDDIVERSLTIERNWVSGSTIEIGCADTSELIFELDNFDGKWSALRWEGARLTVVLDIAGEPLQAGIFTVDEPPRKLSTLQIRALDDMARFNRPYEPGIVCPASLKQILIDACIQCNVTLYTVNFTNGNYVVGQKPEGDDITFHHVVAWIAELAGCNAWIDHLARLQLSWYGEQQPAGNLELTPDDRFSYKLAETDNEITGIVFRTTIPGEGGAEDQEIDYLAGEDRYALVIEDNPLLQENYETVLNVLLTKIEGFSYRPYDFETLSYPHLWPGDKIMKIVDAEGAEHTSIITNHLFKLNGNSRIEARGETETVRGYATGAPFTPKQKRILQSVARMEVSRHTSTMEQAVLRLNELVVNSLGYYETQVIDPQTGAIKSYIHDQATLEESMIIWTMTEQGLAWTDEGWNGGDPDWEYGITADGSIVAKMLDVIGIRAEWIHVGAATTFDEGYDPSEAMAAAGTAQATANSKRRVFTFTPVPPYDVGDLWARDDGQMWVCTTARTAGQSHSASYWKQASTPGGGDYTQTVIDGGLVTTGTVQVIQGGDVAAGITGNVSGNTAVRFWAGSTFANRNYAPFRVTQGGKLYAENAEIGGTININYGAFRVYNSGKVTMASGYVWIPDVWDYDADGIYNEGPDDTARWKLNNYDYLRQSSTAFSVRFNDSSKLIVRNSGNVEVMGNLNVEGSDIYFPYHQTTTNPANTQLTIAGYFRRSTSALKYKTNIELVEPSRAETFFKQCNPVWYRSLCDADRKDWSWYGYIADEVAKVEPRLVQFDDRGEPEGFNYDHVAPLLHVIMKEHRRRIEELEREVASLKGVAN